MVLSSESDSAALGIVSSRSCANDEAFWSEQEANRKNIAKHEWNLKRISASLSMS